jgi:tetratricopeptide (TPR) repeat protein
MTARRIYGTIQGMKLAALLIFLAGSFAAVEAGQSDRSARSATPVPAASTSVAEAYNQYLVGRRLEREDDVDGAIAAFKRASTLDPAAAEPQAELAALYMRQNRISDAITAAEKALKVDAANREAHRVLGTIYAALSETDPRGGRGRTTPSTDDSAAIAIDHLEKALARTEAEPESNLRAALARLYVRTSAFDKAIPILRDLVVRERSWQDGIALLAEAYAGAGKNLEAITWLEEAVSENPRLYATLGGFYERERRWRESAAAYASAVQRQPQNADLKISYASALLYAGGRPNAEKARTVLNEVVSASPTEQRTLLRGLYLLSQAQRRSGDPGAAEATARRLITSSKSSPSGYLALAEALQDRQQYQAVVDTLVPALNDLRTRSAADASGLGLLLPHVGFAYEQLGQYDAAISAFDEAHRLAPADTLVTSYLIQANLSAKKFAAAAELARIARIDHQDDLRLARLHAQALRQNGQPDRGVAVLQEIVAKQGDQPIAYVALAQIYQDANRGVDAVRTLEQAQAKFPAETSIPFELGAVLEKQKRYADAETAFRTVLGLDPEYAPALNYLGYMLADRGERLDESVTYLKKALQIDPENGSYLDSLGWAYFKGNKLDLAEDHLKRAAEHLRTNSVIQDHYADVLFKLGRYDDAIAAWTRALAGDGDSIDRPGIDRKIRSAQQKLKR